MSAADGGPSVLLLGEANLSFALALVQMLDAEGGPEAAAEAYLGLERAGCQKARVTASCYEDRDSLLAKYPEAHGTLAQLAASGRASVGFGVNAWDLRSSFGAGALWDVIAWNHPHLGTEDFRLHGCHTYTFTVYVIMILT